MKPEYLFTTICHDNSIFKYSTVELEIGKEYDVYKAIYFFTIEFEIHRFGEYFTSYVFEKSKEGEIITDVDIESDQDFLSNFYNRQQLRELKLNYSMEI